MKSLDALDVGDAVLVKGHAHGPRALWAPAIVTARTKTQIKVGDTVYRILRGHVWAQGGSDLYREYLCPFDQAVLDEQAATQAREVARVDRMSRRTKAIAALSRAASQVDDDDSIAKIEDLVARFEADFAVRREHRS